MKRLMLVCLMLIFGQIAFAKSLDLTQIKNAQNAFDDGDYAKAIDIYETFIDVENIHNPKLYYNLSNAYYKNGSIGEAYLNILRATRLAPLDSSINYNKDLIRMVLQKRDEQLLLHEGFFISWYSLNQMTVFAAFCIIVFILLLTAFLVNYKEKRPLYKKAMRISAIVVIVSCALVFFKAHYELINNAILIADTSVKVSPQNLKEIVSLPEGKIVHASKVRGRYVLIKTKLKKENIEGWVLAQDIGMI